MSHKIAINFTSRRLAVSFRPGPHLLQVRASHPHSPELDLNRHLHQQINIHDYEGAMKTISEMKERKLRPDHVSYSRLLRLYTDKLQPQPAVRTLHELSEQGVTPTSVQCNTVLHLLARLDKAAELEGFLHDMRRMGAVADERTYLELIRFFAARRDTERVKYYFHEMQEEGLEPTPPIYLDAMWCLAKAGQYEEARAFFDKLRRHHVYKPNAVILNLVLEVAAELKDVALMQEAVQGLWDLGHEPHPDRYSALRAAGFHDLNRSPIEEH